MKRTALKRNTPLKPGNKPLRRVTAMKPGTTRLRPGRSTKKPTVAQAERFKRMRADGCMACRMNAALGLRPTGMKVEIHHILSGGKRLGHDYTIPLCHWHHQAKRFPNVGLGYAIQVEVYGPSLERESRRFAEVYGAQLDLLYIQNQRLKP